MTPRILLIEDESSIRDMVSFALKRADMTILLAADVPEAIEQLSKALPDLILLDWMLPGTSGIQYAKRLKQDELTREIPIIMLTARGEEDDRVQGLDSGIDDYIVKPFSTRELISRIRAVLRRSKGITLDQRIERGALAIDGSSQRVTGRGNPIQLGPTEYRLLYFMMTHSERVYTRSQLLDNVWGTGVYIDERTVDVHIRRLRKALEVENCQDYIQTVRGSGYRFSVMWS
jgi:two-component system, OmpR family, phosphate regulon response regulator PhoB